MSSVYACPVCSAPLLKNDRRWQCPSNHSFDQHKKGYVNLLTVQRKRSKAPGDNVEMVKKRRQFLEAGFYAPLATELALNCQQNLPEDAVLLDAGCGEGYYTKTIAERNPEFQCYGLDISKAAVQAAAQSKNIEWCVASSTHPPYLPDSFDAIISVFSRVDSDPFARILKNKGKVCMVTPDESHLYALRSLIYETVVPYDISKHKSYLDNRFTLVHEQAIQFQLTLPDQEAIQNLLGMTPHAHHLSAAAKERLEQQHQWQDQACFKLYWFEYTDSDLDFGV